MNHVGYLCHTGCSQRVAVLVFLATIDWSRFVWVHADSFLHSVASPWYSFVTTGRVMFACIVELFPPIADHHFHESESIA